MAQMKDEYPVKVLCEVLDCARSTAYYRAQARPDDPALMATIEGILMRWPFYGYRRVLKQLHREGWLIGERVVRRLLKQAGLTHFFGGKTKREVNHLQPLQSPRTTIAQRRMQPLSIIKHLNNSRYAARRIGCNSFKVSKAVRNARM